MQGDGEGVRGRWAQDGHVGAMVGTAPGSRSSIPAKPALPSQWDTPRAPWGLERGEPECRTWAGLALPRHHLPLPFFLLLLLLLPCNSIPSFRGAAGADGLASQGF